MTNVTNSDILSSNKEQHLRYICNFDVVTTTKKKKLACCRVTYIPGCEKCVERALFLNPPLPHTDIQDT